MGALVHVAAAAIGLSALLMSSVAALTVVKLAGAAYLIGLGLYTLVVSREAEPTGVRAERRLRHFFWQPQFVDPAARSVAAQIVVLGLVFVGIAVVSDAVWALAAGTASKHLRASRRFLAVQRYVLGGVFVGLGALTALAKRPS